MLDFEIFGFTPLKFILSNISDEHLWSVLIALFLVAVLLKYAYNLGVFHGIGAIISFVVVAVQSIIKWSWFVLSQSYMMFMFHMDSRKKHYNSAEYWATRKLTLDGIKAVDASGTQQLLIKHLKPIECIILGVLIAKRVVGNILYRVASVTKH